MYSAEVLSQLRSLNWLTQELHRLPPGSQEEPHLQSQQVAIRARLPNSILAYHDGLAARGRGSVAQASGDNCGACHLKLPRDLLGKLALPGRFGVCPNCGIFLWAAEEPPAAAKPSAASKAVRVIHA